MARSVEEGSEGLSDTGHLGRRARLRLSFSYAIDSTRVDESRAYVWLW